MREVNQQFLTGERAMFQASDCHISYCTFADGESPLKESGNLEIDNTLFKWKYPLWYCKNVTMKDSTLFDMARAGIWYTENISIADTIIEAPKTFRRTKGIRLRNVDMPNAAETLWNCRDIEMKRVMAKGDYFAMNSSNIVAENFDLVGNYSFDGCSNVEIHNSRLLSKDAFWNAENVTVYDSFISGEYLGWNSRNITLINCTIESLQGMCYIDNLVMKNCRLMNTNLAFEYSQADVEIIGSVDSVFNPKGGIIRADRIGELILDGRKVKIDQTQIVAGEIVKKSDRASWED
ncbi:DUF3737 family protein [Acetatifactor muris]|jgi:hypothetical protein|uniref:DUF3737 family protein n=1 Tax=Acetatifactor muris TaxID=879566 RepID=A0A2K4ZN84_9FIRM|nr:DUF3737 family protein [Acetatifactor muris]MCI8801591.1 DUF3737 family protein [Lachnospiraceae bacterium]MCR2050303.1 DUF3737 family protein [Acetatifactor muris]SOY31939.1 hypothetical protein AMURIS_04688 [Acetatifactor muris]